eukprot:6003467-Amphidinium_carterae.1
MKELLKSPPSSPEEYESVLHRLAGASVAVRLGDTVYYGKVSEPEWAKRFARNTAFAFGGVHPGKVNSWCS